MLILIYNLDVNKKRKHGYVIHIDPISVYVHNMFELYVVADIRYHIHVTVWRTRSFDFRNDKTVIATN